jgi:hypothetical protein
MNNAFDELMKDNGQKKMQIKLHWDTISLKSEWLLFKNNKSW